MWLIATTITLLKKNVSVITDVYLGTILQGSH
jgi:hypothetical protein